LKYRCDVLGRSASNRRLPSRQPPLAALIAKFEPRDDGQWPLSTSGSQNGTFLNGRRVRESVVRHATWSPLANATFSLDGRGGLD